MWAASVALVLGVIALAGGGPSTAWDPSRWTVIVDRGPGMGLPWLPPATDGPGGESGETDRSGRTRLDVALETLAAHLAEVTHEGDRVRWVAPGREGLEFAPGVLPPADWLRPLRAERGGTPAWERFGAAGNLWVTDRRPSADPGLATLVLAGGAAVPGPVAAVGDELLVWSPEGVREPVPRQRGTVLLVHGPLERPEQPEQAGQMGGAALPESLEVLLRAWARSRGLGGVRIAIPGQPVDRRDVVLVVEGSGRAAPSATVPFQIQEPGFSVAGGAAEPGSYDGTGAAQAGDSLGVRWWAEGSVSDSGRRVPLLLSRPGRVRITIRSMGPIVGDPAAFAVRMAEFLDEALLLPPGVVPLEARRGAGRPRVLAGAAPPRIERPAGPVEGSVSLWCAGLTALAAWVAVTMARARN